MTETALQVQVRTFVALELPPPVIAALVAVQQALAGAQLPLRLPAATSLHLTLAFVGEIPAMRVADLVTAVSQGCVGVAPFRLRAESTGMFPHARAPRVVWVGVQGAPAAMAALTQLRQGIVRALDTAGFPVDRRFDPHLTVARVPEHTAPADRARVGAAVQALPAFAPVPFPIATVSVMRSDLQSSGAVYSRLAAIVLTHAG